MACSMHALQKMWPHFVDVSSVNWPMQITHVKVGVLGSLSGTIGAMGTLVACHKKIPILVRNFLPYLCIISTSTHIQAVKKCRTRY